jgi:hypothetical protein
MSTETNDELDAEFHQEEDQDFPRSEGLDMDMDVHFLYEEDEDEGFKLFSWGMKYCATTTSRKPKMSAMCMRMKIYSDEQQRLRTAVFAFQTVPYARISIQIPA